MPEVNLLARYPRAKRNIAARIEHKEENRGIAMQFGREYFDGTREQGYGGYRYDGRWIPIARARSCGNTAPPKEARSVEWNLGRRSTRTTRISR